MEEGGKGEDVYAGSQFVASKSKANEGLPKIDIDMKLAAHVLLNELHKGDSCENVVCSPLSLEFALHTVAAGSKGETLEQILQFLGLKGAGSLNSMEALNLKSSGIMRVASSNSFEETPKEKRMYDEWEEEPELSFANGIWLNQCYKLKSSYKAIMNSIYDARAEAIDFGNQVVGDINSWVADKTKGLIKEILEPGSLGPNTMLILVNALYFKGLWDHESQLDEEKTEDRDFHLLDGSKVSVPFMTRGGELYYRYRAFEDFKVLQLHYQVGPDRLRMFCMHILLPNETDGLHNLVDKCISDPGFLQQDFELKYEQLHSLWIPKFKFTYKLDDVSGMMENLGLTLPFEGDCQDLTEMVELEAGASLSVSRILHKATIGVDEAGTEAAAVTEVEYDFGCCLDYDPPPSPKASFVADHPPFHFHEKRGQDRCNIFLWSCGQSPTRSRSR